MRRPAGRAGEPPPPVRVPALAAWLGGLGALPFLGLAAAALLPHGAAWTLDALVAYGAVILSFMGGIHWGLALQPRPRPSGPAAAQLAASVLPALVAWPALLLPPAAAGPVLAAAFAVLLAGDLVAVRAGRAPTWYPRLRWPLSAIVVACLLVATAVN